MDYSKIFIKEACPTSIGGQAVMEGVMMQGPDRIALAMRLPSGELYLKTKMRKPDPPVMKMPFVRGVVAFARSLVNGMTTLMESADILEKYAPEEYSEEKGRMEKWVEAKFGARAAWNFLMVTALIFAIVISIAIFVILPTWVVDLLGKWVTNAIVLNLTEGVLRIAIFIGYVTAIRRMDDIMTMFRYHGAEHKTIHCFENGLELNPENADQFYTLHPRCGTSFLVFVLIISLLLFSFLGWPSLVWRIVSRLLLIPVIAGISYELLKWAGRSDGIVVRTLSWPGLMLQKLTTAEPTRAQLEVGILSLKAVLVTPDTPVYSGIVDAEGNLLPDQIDETLIIPAEEPPVKDTGDKKLSKEQISQISQAGKDSIKEGAQKIAGMVDWSKRKHAIGELREKLFSKLHWDIKIKEKAPAGDSADGTAGGQAGADGQSGQWDELWKDGSEALKKKTPDEETEGGASEDAINEAIKFLSELDKDGYTIVTPEAVDGTTIAQAIAERMTIDAKVRTLARRYTHDISTVENALKWGQAALSMIENGRNEATMIMQYATGMTRSELITRSKELMKDDDFEVFEERIQMRLTGTPLQYILGMQEFMGLPFRVNPSVLIPRLDTEIVVEEALKELDKKKLLHPDVLDMCTGSGAIGVSIAALEPESIVTMTDVSQEALKTAAENAGINHVNKRCMFLLGDMFEALPEGRQYDMIISNPPYIKTDVIDTLSVEVKEHEPLSALDGGRDGLKFYRIIAEKASGHLKSGGTLVLEIGSDQAGDVKRLLNKTRAYTNIHKVRDLAGLDRVIIAERI